MELYLIAVVGGFALLLWGAERFVVGAAGTANRVGVPPLIIGLTIVGFGTSAPEIMISAIAAWQGNPGLSIGNAVGSNIANTGLVLGTGAILLPLKVHSRALRKEMPVLIGTTFVVLVLLLDGTLSRLDGALLLTGLGLIVVWIVRSNLPAIGHDTMSDDIEKEIPVYLGPGRSLVWLLTGLVVLLLSSRVLVWGAVEIARLVGVSDLVIGLTIIALGTSLPELATTVVSAIKGEHDIAIGNVIGSNLFNLLAVLGMPALIRPGVVDSEVLTRDYPVMVALTLALFLIGWSRRRIPRVGRVAGALLLSSYLGYQGLIYLSTQSLPG